MINVSPFTKLHFLCGGTHEYNMTFSTTLALIKLRFSWHTLLVHVWNWNPGPQLSNPLPNTLENGTNGHFGMGFSSTEAECLHDILFTLSSCSKKRASANVFGEQKRLLHADASALVDSYWPVTRTDVGGHFCGIAMVVEHANKCAPKAFALLSE